MLEEEEEQEEEAPQITDRFHHRSTDCCELVEGLEALWPAVNYGAIKSFPIESMMNELFWECPSSPIHPVFIANRPAGNLFGIVLKGCTHACVKCTRLNTYTRIPIHIMHQSDSSVVKNIHKSSNSFMCFNRFILNYKQSNYSKIIRSYHDSSGLYLLDSLIMRNVLTLLCILIELSLIISRVSF